jgi:maleylpyruvate isomerase
MPAWRSSACWPSPEPDVVPTKPAKTGAPSAASDEIARDIAGCREATGRLLAGLEVVDDLVAARASLLPGWSVGHVLTHLARNADSFVRILRGAAEGEELAQYAGGAPGREQDIEQGARRPAGEIVDDCRASAASLDEAWDQAPAVVWERSGRRMDGGALACRSLPASRWREVEVHHVDLGLGYLYSDWPEGFVSADLPFALERLPGRIASPAQRAEFLAWVYGRTGKPADIELRSF